MKRGRFLTLIAGLFIVLLLVATLVPACAKQAPVPAPKPAPAPAPAPVPKAEPIVIKVVTQFDPTTETHKYLKVFADSVNEQAKGQLTIEIVGGPEVIPTSEQGEAVRTGVIDMIHMSMAYYSGILPEALGLNLSTLPPAEQRKTGYHDYAVELHKKMNVRYIGILASGRCYTLYLVPEVTKPSEDLKKLKLRGPGALLDTVKAWGAAPVNVALGDVYNAAERGLIDGQISSYGGFIRNKHYEVFKYIVSHPLHQTIAPGLINLDKWNKIPKNLQDLLLDIAAKAELEQYDWNVAWGIEKQEFCLKDGGMKLITLSADEAKWLTDTNLEAQWAIAQKKIDPDTYAKLREIVK